MSKSDFVAPFICARLQVYPTFSSHNLKARTCCSLWLQLYEAKNAFKTSTITIHVLRGILAFVSLSIVVAALVSEKMVDKKTIRSSPASGMALCSPTNGEGACSLGVALKGSVQKLNWCFITVPESKWILWCPHKRMYKTLLRPGDFLHYLNLGWGRPEGNMLLSLTWSSLGIQDDQTSTLHFADHCSYEHLTQLRHDLNGSAFYSEAEVSGYAIWYMGQTYVMLSW